MARRPATFRRPRLGGLGRSGGLGRAFTFLARQSAPRLFAGSFLLLIGLGTLLLKLPGVAEPGLGLTWLDALFTSTSAVCVTGLIVVDTPAAFTPIGEALLLGLIQLGGLGMLTFTSLIILTLGGRGTLALDDAAVYGEEIGRHFDRRNIVAKLVLFTLGCEAAGALALWAIWGPTLGWREAAWPALFHSVSAFCNAGFSTNSDSLVGFRDSPATLAAVAGLIVVGGLGFVTLADTGRALRRAGGARLRGRLSLHARLTLVTTAVLLAGGAVLLGFFEWDRQLDGLGVVDKLTNATFMSVTARTAGFNTIDYGRASSGSNLLTILLMFAGGAAGGTAGGVKVTTTALVVMLAWSRMRGRHAVQAFGRSVPPGTVDRAVGLAAVALTVGVVALLVLTRTETFGEVQTQFLRLMFEAFSALATVGLSMGQTGELSAGGRWVVIVLMFVGRIGPLTAAAAVARKMRLADRVRYAYEDVIVG